MRRACGRVVSPLPESALRVCHESSGLVPRPQREREIVQLRTHVGLSSWRSTMRSSGGSGRRMVITIDSAKKLRIAYGDVRAYPGGRRD